MRCFVFAAACLLAIRVLVAGEPRTWTDMQGRKVEAALKSRNGEKTVLKLSNGDLLTVPVATLSAADREWLDRQADGAVSYDGPTAATDWPRTVILKGLPEVTVVREDPEKREFVYESEHYEFVCDSKLSANLVREISRVFEATWLANCMLPLDFKPTPENGRKKFLARIFTRAGDYFKAGGVPGSAGVYISSAQALMVPLDSLGVQMVGSRVTVNYNAEDYQTLIHEITHQMMNHWLPFVPLWYIEGSAEYVELAEYANGRFSFIRQDTALKNHLYWLSGGRFDMVPLKKLWSINGAAWAAALTSPEGAWRNYASALALTYYFYHLDGDGKGTHMREYLRAIEKLGPEDDLGSLDKALQTHLLRGRTLEALEKDIERGLRRVGVNVTFGADD